MKLLARLRRALFPPPVPSAGFARVDAIARRAAQQAHRRRR